MTRDGDQAPADGSRRGPKAPRESAVTLSQPMDLRHTNLMGNVHGARSCG
jgi:hypothetical protein